MISDFFYLAFRNLKHRGLRSWLTLLGIFIGVVAVVSLISLGSGLKVAVSSQFGMASTELLTVQAGGITMGPPGSGVVTPLTTKDLDSIKKLSSVERAAGRNIGSGKLEYNDMVVFGYATTIPDGEDRNFIYEQLDVGTVSGRFLKDSDVKKVFLGYNFYVDKVGLNKEVIPGKKVLIQNEEFEVVGILDKKGSFIFDNAIYMNENDFLSIWPEKKETLDVIVVLPKDKKELDKTKEDIEKELRKSRDVKVGEENFVVSTPEASLSQINEILNGIQAFVIIIASISIFIGALGIVNTMTTSVLERRKDIGIMKSVGATNMQIFLQFFIEAGLLGLIGGFIGSAIGTLVGYIGTIGINNFVGSEIAPSINFILIFWALIGSFIIGGIAGIAPAMNAARQHPVKALRD